MDYLTENNIITDDVLDIIADLREYSDEMAPPTRPKTEQSAEIAKLTQEYLDAGGTIEYLPYDPTAEILAHSEEYAICASLTEALGDYPRVDDEY